MKNTLVMNALFSTLILFSITKRQKNVDTKDKITGEYSCTRATKPSKFWVFIELNNNSPKCKNSLQEKIPDW
jgi:hypothetical protein